MGQTPFPMKIRLAALILMAALGLSAQHDTSITFQSGSLSLDATLSIPAGNGPFPVVIFVHGSGPNDRDQTLQLTGGNAQCLYPGLYNETIRMFSDLAEAFRDSGIAVLRYDKRTYTHGNSLNAKTMTPYDFIDDIHAAVDIVKTRSEIDTDSIILLGHSQGANFLPIVAQERSDISALLALGTAARGIDSIVAMQVRYLYYYCLNDTATGDAQYNSMIGTFQTIRNGSRNPNSPYQGVYPLFWNDWINITDSSVYNFQMVSEPTLFVHAGADFNIPTEDAQRYENQVTGGNKDIYYLDGLTHYFTNATNPQTAPVVADTIFYWLHKMATVAMPEVPLEKAFSVHYGSDEISIELTPAIRTGTLEVIDLKGQSIQSTAINGRREVSLPKGGPAKGVYILKLTSEGKIHTEKILISK